MIETLKNFLDRANGIRLEVISLANSALRVGQFLLDLVRSGIYPYDPTATYVAGQWVIYNDVLTKVVEDAAANQTPLTHPAKYSIKLVLDPTQVTLSNKLPISASAVRALVDAVVLSGNGVGNASETSTGVVRQATDIEFNQATNNSTYVTPRQVGLLGTAFSNALANFAGSMLLSIVNAATAEQRSAALLVLLNAADNAAHAKLCALNASCEMVTPPVEPTAIIVIEEQYEELPMTGTGIFRVTDAAHTSSLTVAEAGSLQLRVEEQQNSGTWTVSSIGRTWSMVSQPMGATISTGGLLNIAANSISSNVSMGARATLTGGSVVEATILITNVADADSVDVSAPNPEWVADPAIDVTITSTGGSNYSVDFTLRCPSDWQYRFNSFPTWNDLVVLAGGGYDSAGYHYGTSIGPIASGSTVILHVKKSSGEVIDLTVNVTGASARHTIYP